MSVETWVRTTFDFANPERLIALVALLIIILAYSGMQARKASQALAQFVGATDGFERGGRPPQSLSGLAGSLGRALGAWWAASEGVLNSIGRVLLFGYIVPTVALVCVISLGAWLPCQSPLFAAQHKVDANECGARLEDIGAFAMFKQANAATFGALDGFDLLEPKVSIAPTTTAGRWIYFTLGAFVAVAGSLSLLQLIGRWFANLGRRWAFKFEQYAKYKQRSGLKTQEA